MMYTLYDQKTGQITAQTSSVLRAREEASIEGAWPAEVFYISRGQPQRYPPKPTSLFWHEYIWDLENQEWHLNTTATAKNALKHRRILFAYVDKVNPIWYDSMTPEQQTITQQYRQDLLDITRQPGYPEQIDWPSIPGFLRN